MFVVWLSLFDSTIYNVFIWYFIIVNIAYYYSIIVIIVSIRVSMYILKLVMLAGM